MAFEQGQCQTDAMDMVALRVLTRRTLLVGIGAALLPSVMPVTTPAMAEGSLQSAWSKASHSEIRLIAGGPVVGKTGVHRAGIAMHMNQGFKTYWRHPGDSGVPPVFHYDGSENLKSAEVLFPAPHRFADGAGGFSFGYAGPDLILPVRVTATDPSKPVLLKLRMDYAVCEKLCVPASGKVEMMLDNRTQAGGHSKLLLAEQRIPASRAMAEGAAMRVAGLRKADQPEHFLVDVAGTDIAGSGGTPPELFLEGESPWFLETRKFTGQPDGSGTFLVAVIERSKALDCTGADLTLTLVSDKNAVEVRTRLDLALVSP